jgi:hypothetical protein
MSVNNKYYDSGSSDRQLELRARVIRHAIAVSGNNLTASHPASHEFFHSP